MPPRKDFHKRLQDGDTIICAAGYPSEVERRGVLQMGGVTSGAAVDHPDSITARQVLEDFVHCGSDVVMISNHSSLGPPSDREAYKGQFVSTARAVADKTQTLMAGSIHATGILDPKDRSALQKAEAIFKVQIQAAVDEGADFILCDSFSDLEEAKLALKCINQYGNGLPTVMTLSMVGAQKKTRDGIPLPEALRVLENLGADVVGLGCGAGPSIILPVLREARLKCKGPLAALPDAYRIPGNKSMDIQRESDSSVVMCTRTDIQNFAQDCRALGVQLVGLCCGGYPGNIREIAEVYNKQVPAMKFAPDVSKCCKNLTNPNASQAKRRLFQLSQEWRKFCDNL